MWPFKRTAHLTVEEYTHIFTVIADKVTALNEEARKQHMVETGLLPQEHLTREDMLKHRHNLEVSGHDALGRSVANGHFNEDPDLTRRDD